jgi:4-amino-4-deoxy-L-arabinose transferase-like glycosyltransferase
MSPSIPRYLIKICLLGAFLRFLYILLVPTVPTNDFAYYELAAKSILHQGSYSVYGLPDGNFPPGTSLFIALVYLLSFSENIFWVKLVQAALSVADIALLFFISKKVFGERSAKYAALLFALYPASIMFNSVLASENIFLFFSLCLLLLVVRMDNPGNDTKGPAKLFAVGLLLGLSTLTRSIAVLLPIPILIILLLKSDVHAKPDQKKGLMIILVCLIGISMILVPWGLRNYLLFNRFSVASWNSGSNFYMGNNANATGRFMSMQEHAVRIVSANNISRINSRLLNQYEIDDIFWRDGLDYAINNPGKTIINSIKKIAYLFSGTDELVSWSITGMEGERVLDDPALRKSIADNAPFILAFGNGYFFLILFLGLIGLPYIIKDACDRKDLDVLLLLLYVGYFVLLVGLTVSSQRYNFNIMPIFIMFSGYAVNRVIRNKKPIIEVEDAVQRPVGGREGAGKTPGKIRGRRRHSPGHTPGRSSHRLPHRKSP